MHSICVLGAGPIRIGQACEFDYSGVQGVRALREEGLRVVLVNSNLSHPPTGGQPAVVFKSSDSSRHPEVRFIAADVVNSRIPSHHDPDKLSRAIMRRVWQA